jgi:hypothetical protein
MFLNCYAQTKPEWAVVHVEIALFWLVVTDAGTHVSPCYQHEASMLRVCKEFVNSGSRPSTAVAKLHLHGHGGGVALGHPTDRVTASWRLGLSLRHT